MQDNRAFVRSLFAVVAARPRLTTLLGAISISFSGVLYLYSGTSPETAAVFRCLYGLPILIAVALVERRHTRMRRRSIVLSVVAGILFAGDLVFWHHAVDHVGAGLATVLGNLQVVIVAFGTWVLFGEKPSNRVLAGIPIVLIGVVLIAGLISHQAYGTDPVLGVALGTVAALTYAGVPDDHAPREPHGWYRGAGGHLHRLDGRRVGNGGSSVGHPRSRAIVAGSPVAASAGRFGPGRRLPVHLVLAAAPARRRDLDHPPCATGDRRPDGNLPGPGVPVSWSS